MIEPVTFKPGQALSWTSKERCEVIVAEWQRQGSRASFRVYPARENPRAPNAPDWAYVIEAKT